MEWRVSNNQSMGYKPINKKYLKVALLGFLIMQLLMVIILSTITSSIAWRSTPDSSRAPTELSGLPESGKFNYVTLADVNKDGDLDIVAGAGGYPGDSPGGLYVYLNQNGQSFTDGSSGLPGPGKDYFGSVQLIDLNKDTNLDIIASYESTWSKGNSKGIGIWLGNGGVGGSMKWTATTSPVNEGSYDSACCADFNNDGKLDLIGGSSKGIHAWLGSHSSSTLSWTEVSSGLPTTGEYTGVTLGDLNADGRLDIVAGSYNSNGISVYICSSSGSISWSEGDSETKLKQNGNTFDMHLTDLNGDSNLDLVTGIRDGVKVYLGNGNIAARSSWWTEVSTGLPTSADYYQIAVADINGDNNLEIASNFKVWSNSGSMTDSSSYSWEKLDIGISEPNAIGTTFGDLNNDGNLDIVGCGWGSGVSAYTLKLGSGGTNEKMKYLINGIVKDSESNEPISAVNVKLDPGGYSGQTNNLGQYNILVPNGSYTISLTKSGYKSSSTNILVNGQPVTEDVIMEVGSDPSPDGTDDDKKKDDGSLPFMDGAFILIALFVVIIIFKSSYRKK